MRHLLLIGLCGPLVAAVSAEVAEYLGRVRKAMQLSGVSPKCAALTMGLDKAQLSRQLDGQEHLSAKRLALLPPLFHQWLAVLMSEDYGLPLEVTRAARLTWALRARRRMARMALDERREGIA